MRRARLIAAAISLGASAASAQTSPPVQGCWRSDRPLGPTGLPEPVDRDSLFRTVVLQDSGQVAFPMIPSGQKGMWESRSSWISRGDSIALRIVTGLQGWDATLRGAAGGAVLRGTATYLSDAIVVGQAPTRVPVVFSRIKCERGWPSARTDRPPLRPWQRGEPMYFEMQADRPAALRPNSPLPRGTVMTRAVRHDEPATGDSADRRRDVVRIVLQFVVEASGRADTTRLKILSAEDSTLARQVARSVPAMRFTPALLKGQPVHQLAQWVFELRRR
jgi:hypothetical protein